MLTGKTRRAAHSRCAFALRAERTTRRPVGRVPGAPPLDATMVVGLLQSNNGERIPAQAWRVTLHAARAAISRLRIADVLASSDAAPCELCATLGVPSNLLAHHLQALADAGLVTRRRSEGDGRRTHLSLNWHEAWPVHELAENGEPTPVPRDRAVSSPRPVRPCPRPLAHLFVGR